MFLKATRSQARAVRVLPCDGIVEDSKTGRGDERGPLEDGPEGRRPIINLHVLGKRIPELAVHLRCS